MRLDDMQYRQQIQQLQRRTLQILCRRCHGRLRWPMCIPSKCVCVCQGIKANSCHGRVLFLLDKAVLPCDPGRCPKVWQSTDIANSCSDSYGSVEENRNDMAENLPPAAMNIGSPSRLAMVRMGAESGIPVGVALPAFLVAAKCWHGTTRRLGGLPSKRLQCRRGPACTDCVATETQTRQDAEHWIRIRR